MYKLHTVRDLAQRNTLIQTRRGELTLDQIIEWLEISPIVRRFNTWVVTTYGVECLVEYYPIESARLGEMGWSDHLSEKNWMTAHMLRDLINSLSYARDYFGHTGSKQKIDRAVRFAVLKRDGYRCQLCGSTAATGAVLEIDHKVPRAKGGTNDRANLWTLCFDCNRGKRASDL